MKDSTSVSIIAGVCFFTLIILVSCTNTGTGSTGSTPSVSRDTLDQHLYTLWIEADTIKKHINPAAKKSRLLLNYYVDSTNAFTLQGWLPKDTAATKFDTKPSIKLKVIKPGYDSLKIVGKTFLGNIVIRNSAMDTIKKYGETYKYLVFFPKKSKVGAVRYKLVLTDKFPTSGESTSSSDLEINSGANPTPPRQYNN